MTNRSSDKNSQMTAMSPNLPSSKSELLCACSEIEHSWTAQTCRSIAPIVLHYSIQKTAIGALRSILEAGTDAEWDEADLAVTVTRKCQAPNIA